MKKNWIPIFSYIFITLFSICLVALAAMLFYSIEVSRGLEFALRSYSPYFVLGVFAVMGLLSAIMNLIFYRKATSFLINLIIPIAVLNAIVLYRRVPNIAIWCIVVSIAIPLLILLLKKIFKKPFNQILFDILYSSHEDKVEEGDFDFKDASIKSNFWLNIIRSFIVLFISTTVALGWFGIYESYHYTYEHKNLHFSETYILAEEMEVLSKIESKAWQTLSIHEKTDVLNQVVEIEAIRLGIPLTPSVEMTEACNTPYNAKFNPDTNTIEIDVATVQHKDGYKAVKAIAFASFYAYENSKMELLKYLNSPVEYNVIPFSTLVDFKDNRENNQFSFEENAKRFSELVVSSYRRKIMAYSFSSQNQVY